MIKLTKILETLGMDKLVSIFEGNKKLYFGECGKCTAQVWGNAYVKEMKFDNKLERYIIHVRYM